MSFNSSGSKYLRAVPCITDGKIDVYAVLDAFGVTCPARQHAAKKILCSGIRGKGDTLQDLHEARDAVSRAIQMEEQRMNVELCSAGNYMPAPEPPGVYLHGTHCDTCARPDCAKGQYPATKDGGCEGYVKAEEEPKQDICSSCRHGHCEKYMMLNAKMNEQCMFFAAKDTRADSCPKCAHDSDQCVEYRQPDLPCGDFSAKDAPTAAERPAPHTDPAVNVLDFSLPPIALACTAEEAHQKYCEENAEWLRTQTGSMEELVERWDCLQALRTYAERGGDVSFCQNEEKYICHDLTAYHAKGRDVMDAKQEMLYKNAMRDYYDFDVNGMILNSDGYHFARKGEADA